MLSRVLNNFSVRIIATRLVLVLVLVIAVLLVVNPASTASVSLQQEEGWVGIKTDDGILFVWNVRELNFTLIVKGKDIKPLNDPDHIFFMVDGKALQIQVASIHEFAPDAKEKKLDDRAILAAHRDWESTFIEGVLKSKLQLHTFNVRLSKGGDASLWQFDLPEGMNDQAKTELYVTVVREGHVVMLNCEATPTISEEEARKFLLDIMATLKLSPVPIDIQKLSESIRKGAKP